MAGKFEISKSKSDKFLFNLKAGNGEVILTSQMYAAKPSALQGVDSVKENAAINERFERATSSSGQPYFNLKSSNGQVIGRSEMYSSITAMENGVASVKTNAPDAPVVDLTTA
ncbi:MAG: YegP family protein [Propionivibrio sp.]